MKNLTFLSIALLFSILSVCSCVDPENLVPQKSGEVPFDYDIMLNDEIQLPLQPGDRELTFTVSSPYNSQTEEVEIWLEGIPDKVETKIEPQKVKPTANVTITFTDKNIKPGYYPAVMHTKSASGIKKEYPFKLKAMEKLCVEKFSGVYNGPVNCIQGSSGTGSLHITTVQAEKDQLVFWWGGMMRIAKVNCYDRTMTFIEQQMGDSTFSGHGTYTEDYKNLNITYIIRRVNGTEYSCTASYTKQ